MTQTSFTERLKNDSSLVSIDAPSHDHGGALTLLGIDLESATNRMVLIGGLIAGGVVLAPMVLPWVAEQVMGQENTFTEVANVLNKECCRAVGFGGWADAIGKGIEEIPVVGAYLNTSGGENIWMPAATMLGGFGAGSLISQIEKKAGGKGGVGAFVRTASVAIGVVLALPVLLPAIGHGIQYLSRLVGEGAAAIFGLADHETPLISNAQIGEDVKEGARAFGIGTARILGNPDVTCVSEATGNGVAAGTSVLIGHLPCVVPAVITSAAALGASWHRMQATEQSMGR